MYLQTHQYHPEIHLLWYLERHQLYPYWKVGFTRKIITVLVSPTTDEDIPEETLDAQAGSTNKALGDKEQLMDPGSC